MNKEIILVDHFDSEKVNADELFREILVYEIGGCFAYMMAVIEADGASRAYNMDNNCFYEDEPFPDEKENCGLLKIPEDVLSSLETEALKQIELDYKNAEKEMEL